MFLSATRVFPGYTAEAVPIDGCMIHATQDMDDHTFVGCLATSDANQRSLGC